VETSFELVPAKNVPANVFEIEKELAGEVAASSGAGNSGLRNATAGSPSATSALALASTELEIDVAYLLSQAKADRNEQVALTRSASGSLRVEGIVESERRKNELGKRASVGPTNRVLRPLKFVQVVLRRCGLRDDERGSKNTLSPE